MTTNALTFATVLLLTAAVSGGDLIAQTTQHLIRLDLNAHRLCGRTKSAVGEWPTEDNAGCVDVSSMAGSDSATLGSDRKAQGAIAAAPFGAAGRKLAAIALVADADVALPPARALEVVSIGVSGKVTHRPSCRRTLGRATPRRAAAGARIALSGTLSEDPNTMLTATIGPDALTIDVFKFCTPSGSGVTRTHRFAEAVVSVMFAGGGTGESQDLWVLTTATITRITTPFSASSTPTVPGSSGRVEMPLPPTVLRPEDFGYTLPNSLAVYPMTSAEAIAGEHAQSVVIGLYAQKNRAAPIAIRCRIAISESTGPSGVTSCRSVEEEDPVLVRAFAQRTAPFAVSLAAAESTRAILGAGATIGTQTNPNRFAVAVSLATRRGFGVRYFGGSAAWQRGNGASDGGPLGKTTPILAAASVAVKGQENFADEFAVRMAAVATTGALGEGRIPIETSATDALRFETTTGDPRLAIVGVSSAGSEAVSYVQQESGAVQVEHHGDAVDGGWSSFSAFGQCSVQCKTGVKCRTRSCTSPAAVYGGAPCPGADRECEMCQIFTFAWVIGPPSGNCLAPGGGPVCGDGLRHRAVTCERCNERVSDDECDPSTKPPDTEPCSDYYYTRGYGECEKVPAACGKGIRHEGSCRRCDDSLVSLDHCDGSPPLELETIPCDGEKEAMKPFGWLIGKWNHDDDECLAMRDCDNGDKRSRTVRCAMCDGREIRPEFGGDSECSVSNLCLSPGHANFESMSPLFETDYGSCDATHMTKEFPRTGPEHGAPKKYTNTEPFTSQKCPCGAYSDAQWSRSDSSTFPSHPKWWHHDRCKGHAGRCDYTPNTIPLLGRPVTVGISRSEGSWPGVRPSNLVPRDSVAWDKWDGDEEDFYDMGDRHSKFRGFGFLTFGPSTYDEWEACAGDLEVEKTFGTLSCTLATGQDNPPIEEDHFWLARPAKYRRGDCTSDNLLTHVDVSGSHFKMYGVYEHRRKYSDSSYKCLEP